jgi:hypothetical protein
MAAFNYTPLGKTVVALLAKFGKPVPCSVLRSVNPTPSDANKPWRVGAPTVLEFQFKGYVKTLGFPALGTPIGDDDADVLVPGTIVSTGAVGSPGTLCGLITKNDRIQATTDQGTIQYGVLGIQDITPANTPLLIKLRCRAWPQLLSTPQTPF